MSEFVTLEQALKTPGTYGLYTNGFAEEYNRGHGHNLEVTEPGIGWWVGRQEYNMGAKHRSQNSLPNMHMFKRLEYGELNSRNKMLLLLEAKR